jgi:hypothetical protein
MRVDSEGITGVFGRRNYIINNYDELRPYKEYSGHMNTFPAGDIQTGKNRELCPD